MRARRRAFAALREVREVPSRRADYRSCGPWRFSRTGTTVDRAT